MTPCPEDAECLEVGRGAPARAASGRFCATCVRQTSIRAWSRSTGSERDVLKVRCHEDDPVGEGMSASFIGTDSDKGS